MTVHITSEWQYYLTSSKKIAHRYLQINIYVCGRDEREGKLWDFLESLKPMALPMSWWWWRIQVIPPHRQRCLLKIPMLWAQSLSNGWSRFAGVVLLVTWWRIKRQKKKSFLCFPFFIRPYKLSFSLKYFQTVWFFHNFSSCSLVS